MGLFQYIQDTRGELRHVAWPTRLQTIVYTIIVIALSLLVALYLGFFDYIFTTSIGRGLTLLGIEPAIVITPDTASSSLPGLIISTSTPE